MGQTKTKKVYFELMRIIAVTLVLFNHLKGYQLYQTTTGIKQWIYMFISAITRINVPLFFMISGALLLKKEEDYSYVIRKRLSRIILLMLVFEAGLFCCYKLYALIHHNSYSFTLIRFIRGFFAGNLDGTKSYWYLYAYISILLTLPFMQRIAARFTKQDFQILVGFHFILLSLLPMVNYLLVDKGFEVIKIDSYIQLPFADRKAFFYPLMGYYLENAVDVKKLNYKSIALMLLAAFTGIALSGVYTYWEGTTTGTYTQKYISIFDYVTTMVAFVLIKYLVVVGAPKFFEDKAGAVICTIGSLTLGIYLLDPYFRIFIYNKYLNLARPHMPTMFESAGWIMISMILGGSITFILKHIPLIRKLI